MATAVKADEAPYPVQVRFFGSRTAVANAQRAAYLVEQARRAYVTRWLLRGWWTAHRTGVIGTDRKIIGRNEIRCRTDCRT